MALGGKKEPPQKVTVLRLIFPVWTAVEEAALEVDGEAPAHHLYVARAKYLAEAALIYLAFAVPLLSSSFISG